MPEGQEAIYYLTGKSREAISSSPHLEAFRKQGYEVLLLSDAVDEVWVQSVFQYKEKPFQSVGKGVIELGSEEEKKEAEEARQEKETACKDLLEYLREKLSEEVKEVRLSARLTDSPACLVGEEADLSPQLEQMLRATGQEVPKVKRILELNPEHEVLVKLQAIFEESREDPRLEDFARLLFGQAILAEGGLPPDPGRFSRLLAKLMVLATG